MFYYDKQGRKIEFQWISCACGCGEIIRDHNKNGPVKYKNHHNVKRENNSIWKGGIRKSGRYKKIRRPHHKFVDKKGYVFLHRYLKELDLGRYLDPKEKVHHDDNNPDNNSPENLILLENHSQHFSIHVKQNWKNNLYKNQKRDKLGRFITYLNNHT